MAVVGLVLVAIIALIGFYFWQDHQRWQGYRNDPQKKVYIEKIEKLLSKENKTQDDYLTLGNSYYSLEEYDSAVSAYNSVLELGGSDVADMNIGNAYAQAGEYKKAQTKYMEMIKKRPGDTDPYLKLADIYTKEWQGKDTDVLGILLKAYEIQPDTYDVIVRLANYYKESGEKDKALEFFKKALEKSPGSEDLQSEINLLSK